MVTEEAPETSLLDQQMSYCEGLTEVIVPYQDLVTEVFAGEQLDPSAWVDISIALTELDPTGFGAGWENDHAKFMSIHDQIEQVLNDGGGNLTLQSDDYKEGIVAVMERCVDIGYSAAP